MRHRSLSHLESTIVARPAATLSLVLASCYMLSAAPASSLIDEIEIVIHPIVMINVLFILSMDTCIICFYTKLT